MFKKILVLSPHPDDAEIAAGATIAKFLENNSQIYYVTFSSCEKSVPDKFPKDVLKKECKKATKALGIKSENLFLFDYEVRTFPLHRQEILENMVKLVDKIKPDLVILPSSNDIHQDHQTIHNEGIRAFKKTSSIWGYEHPWNNLSFTTDIFVKLEKRHVEKKINCLKNYQSQNFRVYFNEEYIKGLAYTRGVQIGIPLAETFEMLRLLIK